MNIFKKLFGLINEKETPVSEQGDVESPYAPDNNLPIDEQFTSNFKKNGGKFLYCDNLDEIKETFLNILVENDWFESQVSCFEPILFHLLDENNLTYTNVADPSFFFATCENLIADDGSILFSSNQLKHFKINELPLNMVIFAKASQIVGTRSDAMRAITARYDKQYPNNITTIKYFEKVKEEDFLHYGSCHKNLYLLLMEDY